MSGGWRDALIVVDTETTGLHPDDHQVWEMAWGTWDGDQWVIQTRQVLHDASNADDFALDIGGWRERFAPSLAVHPADALVDLMVAADGKHMAGMVPSFDEERLRRLAARHGIAHTWHYHIVDAEPLCVGLLAARGEIAGWPWKSDALSLAVGVDPEQFHRHSAAGDVKWCIALLEAVFAPSPGVPS